jgi:hypothetical protein
MKDNLPYFEHDNNASLHPKMKALISKYDHAGYGKFWILNEMIARSPGAYIDISKKINKLDLANELRLSENELDDFLNFLSDPQIDLINNQDGKITTDRVTECFYKTMKGRKSDRERKQGKNKDSNFPDGNNDFPSGNDQLLDFQVENGNFQSENDNFHVEKQREEEEDNTRQEEDKRKTRRRKESNGSTEPSLSDSQKSALELSELLLTSHRKEFPDYLSGNSDNQIKKKTDGWAADIEKLIRIDKKDPEIIRQVILWVKTPNNFWFHNIESGSKLRKQFERLYGEMKTKNSKRSSAGTSSHRIARDNVSPDDVDKYFN